MEKFNSPTSAELAVPRILISCQNNKRTQNRCITDVFKCRIQGWKKKLAASSMLHEAKIAYYAFDVIVYCMYTHQTRIAYMKRTH